MSMIRRVPSWVRRLPDDDTNKEIYLRLLKSGKRPLHYPREIMFSIKGLSRADAAAAASIASKQGWEPQVNGDPGSARSFWVEFVKNTYEITEGRVDEDEMFFMRLARMYDGVYDGWVASAE